MQRGQKDGVGEYVWPSGAIYRGEWRDGYMHGAFPNLPPYKCLPFSTPTAVDQVILSCLGSPSKSALQQIASQCIVPSPEAYLTEHSIFLKNLISVEHNASQHVLAAAGTGTMQGPDGSVFTGGWNKDVKHGLGRKVYSNGDVYEVWPVPTAACAHQRIQIMA